MDPDWINVAMVAVLVVVTWHYARSTHHLLTLSCLQSEILIQTAKVSAAGVRVAAGERGIGLNMVHEAHTELDRLLAERAKLGACQHDQASRP